MSETPSRSGAALPPELARRVDAVCNRFEAAWRAGKMPRLDDFLVGWDEPDRSVLHRELLDLDAYYRQRGATPELEPAEKEMPETAAGRVVGDYQLLEEIARGGMGVIYRARQVSLNRIVALKMVLAGQLASPEAVVRFRTEAENAAGLDHPHIVPIYEVGEHEGQHFFSMKLIEGGGLNQYLERYSREPRRAAALLATIAEAVHYAHQRGILHRDLKPANILLDERGQPHVTDFGLAKKTAGSTDLTQSGALVGTPNYMAPEQALGESKRLTTAADVYSLGVILYELLTGRPPFRAATVLETLQQVVTDEPVPPRQHNPRVPRDLETICLKCLQKEPARRYASALELAAELRRFQAGEPIEAKAVSPWERLVKWARRKPAAAALAIVSVAAVLAAGAAATGFVFSARLQEERDEANRQRQKAETAEADAEAEKVKAQRAKTEAENAWALVDRLKYFADADRAQRSGEVGEYGRMRELLDSLGRGRPGQTDLPGFEYHYLQRQCHLLRFLRGHTDWVSGVNWSPDGQRLASASRDKTVKLWDLQTGKEILTIEGAGGVVSWSPDGRRLASASGVWQAQNRLDVPAEVKVWDAESGKEVFTLRWHTRSVSCLSWSPDGKRLASASNGNDFQPGVTIKIWDMESGKEGPTLRGHWGPVWCLSWSPDGQRLASSAGTFPSRDPDRFAKSPNDDSVKIWDTKSGKEILMLKGHTDFVMGVSWSPDGQRLASASRDKTVRIWDARTGKEALKLNGHRSQVHAVSWSPDGQRLASASDDQTMRVWDAGTGQEVLLRGHTGGVLAVSWSPDGRRLASASSDRTVGLWDIQTGKDALVFRSHTHWVYGVSWCPDGLRLASGSTDGTVRVWDARTGQEKWKLPVPGGSSGQGGPSWSPDGKRLATGSSDGLVKIWDAKSGKEVFTLRGHPGIACLSWSPDSRRLASGGNADRIVQAWDVESGQEVLSLHANTVYLRGLTWSPDGKRLATAGVGDQTVKVWDVESGHPSRAPLSLPGDAGDVWGVSWSPDGRLASACRDGTVRLWDLEAGKEILALRGHTAPVTGVAWSPDGRRLAGSSNDLTVRVWETQTGQETLVLKGHTDPVQGVTWSPDGQRLATASHTRTR
jgi:WD40 repeat protein/tRNA A-37 threonylcarbamoyl transferase component Bud32